MEEIPAKASDQPSVLNEPPSKPTQRGLKSIGLVVVPLLILGGLLGYFYLRSSETSETTKGKKWTGVLATREGLVKISPEGELEKDNNDKIEIIVPPWTKTDKVSSLRLLKNGQVVFTTRSEDSLKYKKNVVYSWNIDSSDPAKDFFTVKESKKIGPFAISPDSKQIALISYTRSGSELYEGLENLSQEELKKLLVEREKQFQDELRTISIYDLSSGSLTKSLKKKLLDSPSRRTGGGKLLWNEAGLFSLDRPEITLFDTQNWEVKDSIPDVGTGLGPLHEHVVISPDGSKYFNPTDSTLAVKKVLGGEVIAKFDAPEFIPPEQINDKSDLEKQIVFVGPAAFSSDSKKVMIQGGSVRGTNFMVWELDLATNKTKKIGDSEITSLGSTSEVKSFFLFLTYNPSANRIIFAANKGRGNEIGPSDLFSLKLGEQKATFIDSFEGLDASFLGWYLSN